MIMGRFRRRPAAPTDAARNTSGTAGSPPEPRRRRHAVFYDVENSSSPDDVSHVMSKLKMDRSGCDTQLVAVGNWRVIGQQTARLLARQGAELVHSAPSSGVRDWSDLRIAVDAGIWLGTARPGDTLHIVSDDQAFDAVGDVAATLGVEFSRIMTREQTPSRRPADSSRTRTRRAPAEPRTASHDEIMSIVRRLTANGWSRNGTTLDVLSNELKNAGFSRAPGSLRLITRLRRMKELEVGADGSVRLVTPQEESQPPRPDAETAGTETPRKRTRRGRRGGRRRSGLQRSAGASTEPAETTDAPEQSPQPGPTPVRS